MIYNQSDILKSGVLAKKLETVSKKNKEVDSKKSKSEKCNMETNKFMLDDLIDNTSLVKKRTLPSINGKAPNRLTKEERIKLFEDKMNTGIYREFKVLGEYKNDKSQLIFLHTVCENEFSELPRYLFKRENKCPYCSKNKDKYKAKILDSENKIKDVLSNYNGEYEFIETDKEKVALVHIRHNKCGNTFKYYKSKIIKNKAIECPYCKEVSNSMANTNLKYKDTLEKIQFYEEKLLGEIKILNNFNSLKDKVMVQKESCGDIFETSISALLLQFENGDINCPICEKRDRFNMFKKNLFEKYSGEYEVISSENDYENISSRLKVKHNICGKELDVVARNILYKDNFKCSNCKKENKLSLLIDELDSKYDSRFEFVDKKENFINEKTVLLFKDSICQKTFKTSFNNLFKSDNFKCPECNRIDRLNHLLNRLNREIKGEFEFADSIDNFINDRTMLKFKHTKCQRIFETSFSSILNKKNMKNGCKECKRIDRLNDLKYKLKLKYDGRYELIDNDDKYKTNKTPLMFYDNKCKSRIRSSFDLLLNKKRFNCPNCEYKKGNYKKEITTEVLRHEVFDKFKGEYVLVGQYEDSTTKILFRHVKCQRVFNMTRANFLRTKTPCKECYKASKALGINKAQEKLNSKFGRLFTLHGEYKNMHTKIPITCNNCKITKEESLSNRLRRTCCPNCKKEFL